MARETSAKAGHQATNIIGSIARPLRARAARAPRRTACLCARTHLSLTAHNYYAISGAQRRKGKEKRRESKIRRTGGGDGISATKGGAHKSGQKWRNQAVDMAYVRQASLIVKSGDMAARGGDMASK